MSDELRECPFGCKGEARVRPAYGGGFTLEHNNLTTDPDCLVSIVSWFKAEAEAIDAWNRRADETPYPREEASDVST